MPVCSVSGCESAHETSDEAHHPFPANFDLCMQWVQTCGKAAYFEDFAYGGGTLPFIERTVCSKNFEASDFIDPNNKLLVLKDEVIPVGDVKIKKVEGLDPDLEGHCRDFDDSDPTEFEETHMKTEPPYQTNNEFLNDHDYLSDQNSYEFNHPMLPLLVIASKQKLIWKKKPVLSSHKTWSQALENVDSSMHKNPDENEKRKPKRNEDIGHNIKCSANESKEERKERLYKNAVRVALRRSLESEEQIRERRLKNALRAAYRRSVETPEQRTERRRKDLLRSARRRREETELQSKIRKYNDAVRAAFRRRNETPEQRAQRKMIDVLRAARRRSEETPEQREARLKADRERAAKRRFFKKLNVFDSEESAHQEIRYFNVKIMQEEESNRAFRDASGLETVMENVDVILGKKTKVFAEQKNIPYSTAKLQSELKLSQTTCCTFNVKSVINTEFQNSGPGFTDANGIEGKDFAFNGHKKSEIVW